MGRSRIFDSRARISYLDHHFRSRHEASINFEIDASGASTVEIAKKHLAARRRGYRFMHKGVTKAVLYDPSLYDRATPEDRNVRTAWKVTIETATEPGTQSHYKVLVDMSIGEAVLAASTVRGHHQNEAHLSFDVPIYDNDTRGIPVFNRCMRKPNHRVCEGGMTGDPNVDCPNTDDPDADSAREFSHAYDAYVWDWFNREHVHGQDTEDGDDDDRDYSIVIDTKDKFTGVQILGDQFDFEAQWRGLCNIMAFEEEPGPK